MDHHLQSRWQALLGPVTYPVVTATFLPRPREAQTGPRVMRRDKARHLYLWGDGQQRRVTFVHVTIGRFLHSVSWPLGCRTSCWGKEWITTRLWKSKGKGKKIDVFDRLDCGWINGFTLLDHICNSRSCINSMLYSWNLIKLSYRNKLMGQPILHLQIGILWLIGSLLNAVYNVDVYHHIKTNLAT